MHIAHRPERSLAKPSQRLVSQFQEHQHTPTTPASTANAHSVTTWAYSATCVSMKTCGKTSPLKLNHHISPHKHRHHKRTHQASNTTSASENHALWLLLYLTSIKHTHQIKATHPLCVRPFHQLPYSKIWEWYAVDHRRLFCYS
uniref:Uncharacterized protein n=1 Tax=Schistocephalus solidus TaxID=70667 RepID=A0A0X3QH06_SCHSO